MYPMLVNQMIRRVEIIFRKTGVWSGGSAYVTRNTKYYDGQVIWAKDYPRGYHMRDIWSNIRKNCIDLFVDNIFPDVVWRTKPPNPRYTIGENPNQVLNRQSEYIQKRVVDFPQLYEWNKNVGKWHMSEGGYLRRTVQLGGHIDIGVSNSVSDIYYDDTLVDSYEKQLSGQTKSFVLFVYPDRYDEDVRAMYELRVTYW